MRGKPMPNGREKTAAEISLAAAAVVAVLALAPGCGAPDRVPAVPRDLTHEAEVPGEGLAGVRYHPILDLARLGADGAESVKLELAHLASTGHKGPIPPACFLAVSGGGDNGAFGAGLLCGWTERGDRPEWKLVTGVSTGALIAPFAFLGPKYDATLRECYTNVSLEDIAEPRWLFAAVTNDAMADNAPLWRLLSKHVTRELLDAIAAEHDRGRILLVGTTNLDARQPVIWNMTKIAKSKDPRALELFRAVLVASAAIPGAFPPTMIDVEAGGKPYQEMHVDGGTMAQVFVYPPALHVAERAKAAGFVRERRVYVIRNSRLDPEWASVERQTLTIAGRSIGSLIHSQGIGDLYRIFVTTQRDGVDYNLAYIPPTFDAPHKEEFDTEYMRALFELGRGMAVKGYPWQKYPPGYEAAPPAPAAAPAKQP
jgi:predicted acylesterase/phospholipase RssA